MNIRSSLKRKSIVALAAYMFFVITLVGTVSYMVVEPPVRSKLIQNLDLNTQLISNQINAPLSSSLGVLQSIVSIGNTGTPQAEQAVMLHSLFTVLDGIAVSGGLWPEPYSVDPKKEYTSLFYNRATDGVIDKIDSWNNPETGGYNRQDWYLSAANQPLGTVTWSQVYIDAYTHVQMITASSPYYVNGRFAGVATIDLSLKDLVEFVNKQAEDLGLGVLVKDGYGEVITEHNFRAVKGIYVSKLTFGNFNWSVDVVNAKKLISERVFEIISNVELGIIPLMLLLVMVGYFLISRYLIKPISVIAQKVDDSKEGGVIDLAYKSNDEIRHLIDTFNQKTVYLEAEKVKAQASTQAKSSFLATLSHEIRTPMNGVLGTAQLLLKTNLNEEQRKHLKSLYDSGDHMMTLLNEILDFSKIEQGHLELERAPFPLASIIGSINSVYHTLCTEKGLVFKVYSEISPERWYMSDKARVRQVLFNLLNNAVKFTSRGFVEVNFKEQTIDDQSYLLLTVRDTGIGISQEAQDKIFRPFEQAESSTTRRYGGTGLGLAIVKQICELMDGDISVTSQTGIGTSFEVNLQLEICEPGSVEIKLHRKLNYDGLQVLIVEDNRTNTIIIDSFMKSKGFTCHCVENGEEAIRAISNQHFDLVLMDNHMPIMDGVEASNTIRTLPGEQRHTLIFGCTADVFKETRERMLGAGVDYIIAKPIDENELDDALYRYSEKLYQFHPEQNARLDAIDFEDVLVNLYVSIENKQYETAESLLEKLICSVDDTQNPQIGEALEKILTDLRNQVEPSKEDLDLITVLMAEQCHM
ncbi:ATP-binding protein [Vibrio sp. S4M6]|uniref:hybrid sensor histidine kinase/response regulator n=1 Tax=Vibrio sinus TaxID=2946865 RepID=UPI00202A517F|nr:hybrid sensor histidine kinase/response regulator [Vibrio sinus]MCL9782689.1 ATP-binding protein [Vibrio sinus]